GVDLFDVVDEEVIAEVLANWTGIPVTQLTEEETAKLLRMEDELHKRVVGQQDAIKAVSQAIRRTRAGLKDPKRPSGSFIFLGPSGVGKTETAKTLAEFLFGDENHLIQLDMSEYMEKHTVSIMTSNLGTADLRKASMGFAKTSEAVSYEKMKEKVNDALKQHFRPEFLNRIDETIVFHELSKDEVTEILDIQMVRRLRAQL